METSPKLLENSLLVIWNVRDSEKRLQVMHDIYDPEIVFYESNDGPPIKGYTAINNLIAKLQKEWPSEFAFELATQSRINHDVQLITWKLGIPGHTPVATGSDIAVIKGGKIISLHLLLDLPDQTP